MNHAVSPRRCCCACIGLVAAATFAGRSAFAEGPVFFPLPLPAAPLGESIAAGISADGSTVVGGLNTPAGPAVSQAFRWTRAGGYELLGFLPGGSNQSGACAVSADGSVVVGFSHSALYPKQAFRWTAAGGMQGLAHLGEATAVSADGAAVVGWTFDPANNIIPERAFRWTAAGGVVTYGPLPEGAGTRAYGLAMGGSVIVGASRQAEWYGPVLWTGSGPQSLGQLGATPGFEDRAAAVTPDGAVVVGTQGDRAFRWTAAGGMQPLGVLPGMGCSYATAVSADGATVVGYCRHTPQGASVAFIWDEANGMRDLQSVLAVQGGAVQNWLLGLPVGIAADGTIVGWGKNPTGVAQSWLARPGGCYANCDGSTVAPILNVADYVCFLNKYYQGDPGANCDGSTAPPVLNVADFICFQTRVAAGCG